MIAGGILVAILAVGGAPRWAQAMVALVACGAVLTTLTSRRGLERYPPLVVLLLAAAGWTLLQLVPLPGGLVDALSPVLDDLRRDGAKLAGVTAPTSLTMDVPGSLRALTFLSTLAGVAVVALRLAASERGRYALCASVALAIGLAAVITGLHGVFGARSLYGIYHPLQAAPSVMGPLLNSNHLGSLMAIGAITSVGLLLYQKQSAARRVGWAAIGLACVAIAATSLSRGAILGFAAGLVVTLLTSLLQRLAATEDRPRRSRERLFSTTVPIGIIITCGLTVAIYVGAGSVIQQLENTSLQEIHEPTSKFAAWRSSVQLVDDSPWVGVGRNAFEPTFTRVHPASAFATFSHPENEAVQSIVEWGVPAAIALGVIAIWMLRRALRRWKDGPLAAGALGALAAIAFQSNFDFGIEMLGIAVPITVLAATLTYGTARELSPQRLPRIRLVRALQGLVLLGSALLLLASATRTVEEDHVALRADATPAHAREVIARHPLDYLGYAVLAESLIASNDPAAIAMLNHAMRLHPTLPGLHRLAARLLLRMGRTGQAESEYATALRYTLDRRALVSEMLTVLPPERVARALPVESEVAKTVRMFQDLNRVDVAVIWLDLRLAASPTLDAADAMYSIATQQKNLGAAERGLRARCRVAPSSQCQLALARILQREDKQADVADAVADVATWHGTRAEQLESWLLLCDARAKLAQLDAARACLHDLEVSGLVDPGGDQIRSRRDALLHQQ